MQERSMLCEHQSYVVYMLPVHMPCFLLVAASLKWHRQVHVCVCVCVRVGGALADNRVDCRHCSKDKIARNVQWK